MKLHYQVNGLKEIEVKPITGRVLKELSKGTPTIKGLIKAISDTEEPGDLSVIDALRIIRESWCKTYDQDFMLATKYCPKCTSLNELKIDMSDKPFEKPDIHKGEMDFEGKAVTFSPLTLKVYDKPNMDDLDILESVCSLSIDDLTLPKIKLLNALFQQESKAVSELIDSKHKCSNKECGNEILFSLDFNESLFVQ